MKNVKLRKEKKQKTPGTGYNMWQTIRYMTKLAWVSGEKKVLALGLLSALLAVAGNLVNLYVSPGILSAVERHAPLPELLLTILGFTLGIMLASAASAYVNENIRYGRITIRMEIVKLLNRKAAVTSYPNLDDGGFKNFLEKAFSTTYSNSDAAEDIWRILTELLTNILGFLIYLSLLSAVSPLLICVISVTSAISFFIGNYVNGYGYRHREEEAEYHRHLWYSVRVARRMGCAKDIRIFGLRPWLDGIYDAAMEVYTAFHRKVQGVYLWAGIADLVFAFLRNGIAYAYLIGLMFRDGFDVAQFLLLFSAAGGFGQWVTGILGNLNVLHRQCLDLSAVRECLEYAEPFRFEEGVPLQAEPGRKYEIRLEGVSYRYPGAEEDTLEDIDLVLHPGEKLAVVGVNGAGKTTLVKLICGFLDPTGGRVLLDGRDIREYNRADYYRMFSAVFQQFSLLPGSIAVNVAQEEARIDRERVEKCVEMAGLKSRIDSLPGGCDTYLNREVYEDAIQLSGGETQRLMLARALYKDAPIIVLDEPTAALDPIAESEMYRKYDEMTAGRSSVYISHRLASTRFCDRIIMLDQHRIYEEGTHEELLRLGGKYAGLYEVQSRYYKKGNAENGEG